MKLYANINKSSKYHPGQLTEQPFAVVWVDTPGEYCWDGNQNSYRTSDLDFFIRTDTGEFVEHGLLSCIDSMAERMLCQMLSDIQQLSLSGHLSNLDYLFELRRSSVMQTMEKILTLLPEEIPRCKVCGKSISYCYCERH